MSLSFLDNDLEKGGFLCAYLGCPYITRVDMTAVKEGPGEP